MVLFVVLIAGPILQAAEITSGQIKADWLRQEQVRYGNVEYDMAQIVAHGMKLAENLTHLGLNIDEQIGTLNKLNKHSKQLPDEASEEFRRDIYLQARWVVRRMMFSNPLLDFDTILFVKRAPGTLPHMSDQYYGWWSRPGGGLFLLHGFKSDNPHLQCLTEAWPEGSFLRPDLSYDGRKILFAYCKYYPHVAGMEKVDKDKLPEDAFYQIYEMKIDGTGTRQLTRGRYDDFDARYRLSKTSSGHRWWLMMVAFSMQDGTTSTGSMVIS